MMPLDHHAGLNPTVGSIAKNEEAALIPFPKCPMCGGEVVRKQTEKLLRGGTHLAIMTVDAEVCLHCGEPLCSADTMHSFAQIRAKLDRQRTAEFELFRRAIRVPV